VPHEPESGPGQLANNYTVDPISGVRYRILPPKDRSAEYAALKQQYVICKNATLRYCSNKGVIYDYNRKCLIRADDRTPIEEKDDDLDHLVQKQNVSREAMKSYKRSHPLEFQESEKRSGKNRQQARSRYDQRKMIKQDLAEQARATKQQGDNAQVDISTSSTATSGNNTNLDVSRPTPPSGAWARPLNYGRGNNANTNQGNIPKSEIQTLTQALGDIQKTQQLMLTFLMSMNQNSNPHMGQANSTPQSPQPSSTRKHARSESDSPIQGTHTETSMEDDIPQVASGLTPLMSTISTHTHVPESKDSIPKVGQPPKKTVTISSQETMATSAPLMPKPALSTSLSATKSSLSNNAQQKH